MAADATPDESGRVRWERVGAVWLVTMTILAYAPALGAGYIWDDDHYILLNETLRSWHGLWRIWFEPTSIPQYYPLVHTTFWVEYQIWGVDPRGYHFVNVAIHAASALVLWRMLRQFAVPGAWVAAAVFALHPVHVESVAWVTERKNTLATLFYLMAMWTLLPCFLGGDASATEPGDSAAEQGESDRPARHVYAIGFAWFVCALLSKTVTCSLPAALLVLAWWRHGTIRLRHWALATPMLLLGLIAGLFTAYLEKHHVGAGGVDFDLSSADRVLIAGRAVWFYFGKLVWPHPLAFIYTRWEIDAGQPLQWFWPIAAALLLLGLWFGRKRWGRAPLAMALIFGGTLVPALGFVDVYPMRFSFVADHFQYPASIAVIVLLVSAAARGIERLGWKTIGLALSAALIALLAGLTAARCTVYLSAEALWRDTIAKSPTVWMAHNNLGAILLWDGKHLLANGQTERGQAMIREARQHLERARALYDDAAVLANLGEALATQGQHAEALEMFQASLALDDDYRLARLGLIDSTLRLGNEQAASRAMAEYLEDYPHFIPILLKRARLLTSAREESIRDPTAAIELATRACELTSFQRRDALEALAEVLERTGRPEEAARQRARAARLPSDVVNELNSHAPSVRD